MNLTKEVKDLYIENYKTFTGEIEKEINKWKDSSCSWTRRINTVKLCILIKAQSYLQIQHNPYKIPVTFFTETEKKILKFIWKSKRSPNGQSKKDKASHSTFPDSRAIGIKTIGYWYKSKHQWNRIES